VIGVARNAQGQAAASATLLSNDLYRGLSLSQGQPALDLTVTYDSLNRDSLGVYAGGSAIGETTGGRGPRILGEIAYLGYSARRGTGPNLDVGVQILNYRAGGDHAGAHDAAEIYAGWVAGSLNAYVHYSPDYFNSGERTLYGEVNDAARLARRWRLFVHAGALSVLGGGRDGETRYDVRAGIAAAFKGGEAQLSWTTTLPNPNRYSPYAQGAGIVAIGVTLPL
jgi:uncharacterized protein (TIGR02001 family)